MGTPEFWAPKPKAAPAEPEPDVGDQAHDEGWRRRQSDNREYAPRGDGKRGVMFRDGTETVTEARARLNAEGPKLRGKGRKRDPTPGKRAPGGERKAPTTAELEAVLAELLSAPAIPAAAIWHCDYCTQHFVVEGPRTAHQLAGLSENNPAFRRLLVRLHETWTAITYGGVLLSYVGKPVLHHLAPDELLATAGPLLGVPLRPPPAPPAAPANGDNPAAPPVAGKTNRPPYAAGAESPQGA